MSVEPTYQRGPVTLYLGDAREILPSIEADAMVTDPPFGIEHESHHGASWMDTQIAGDGDTALRDFAVAWAEARRIPWACFGVWTRVRPAGTRHVLIWDKGPNSGMGDLRFPWKPSFEDIYVGGKGWHGRRDEGVIRNHTQLTWESKGRKHPHAKPVSLLVAICRKLPKDCSVVDPFMGTGPTIEACIGTGHPAIGCEIAPHYFGLAVRRIDAALDQKRLSFPTEDAE